MPSTPANSLDITTAGLVKFDGTATFSAVTVTQHDILVGAASNGITNVAPSSTSGVPVISQGASADPTFGTAVVAGGGTGATSFNINGPVISSTTTTGALSSVTLNNQTFLVGNTSAAPTAKAFSVVNQVFTSTGTYTPTSGMVYCIVQCLGGGGAGGGNAATAAATVSIGGGGGAGEYAIGAFSAATIGASKAVTIGAAGTGNSGTTGGNGGTTSVGSTLISAAGGSGGPTAGAATANNTQGGLGGTGGTGGDYRTPGSAGGAAFGTGTTGPALAGQGASSQFGAGGIGQAANTPGQVGLGNGSGGSGAAGVAGQGAQAGGNGTKGIVFITEYVIS